MNFFYTVWNTAMPSIFFALFIIVGFFVVFGGIILICYSVHIMNKVLKIYLQENNEIIYSTNDKKRELNSFFIRYGLLFLYFLIIIFVMHLTGGLALLFLLFFNHKLKKILKK